MSQLHSQVQSLGQVCIIGTGLLGASLGLELRALGYRGRIVGIGRRRQTVDRAVAVGAIDQASTQVADAAGSDLIVLATPVSTFQSLLRQLAETGVGQAVLTDVGSTKRTVVADAQALLLEPCPFVGSHPMAGSEQRGPQAARQGLFRNKPVVLTPTHWTDPRALSLVEALWSSLGMRVLRMTPDEHDDKVARISHLPHALAVLVVQLAHERGGLEVASTGFADVTRIASGDPELWADIFLDNADAVIRSLDHLELQIEQFRLLVKHRRQEALLEMLEDVKNHRDDWAAECARLDAGERPADELEPDETPDTN